MLTFKWNQSLYFRFYRVFWRIFLRIDGCDDKEHERILSLKRDDELFVICYFFCTVNSLLLNRKLDFSFPKYNLLI